jgi:type IX secretion system PorP/SprF family membrane protein
MKMRKISLKITGLVLFIVLVLSKNTSAQYDAMFTQYMFNEMFINPAYAGSKEAMSVNLLHRQQWMNFPGRPITTTFSVHGPLMNKKMGVGLSVLNEQIGKLNRNIVYLDYAYRIKAGDNGTLSFGLMAGIHNQVNKLSELKASENGDIQISQNTPSMISPNFGAGLYYLNKNFYAGLSIPRMVDDGYMFNSSGSIVKNTSFSAKKFHYYLTAGYVYEINDDVKLKPQAMIKVVQNAPLQYDININALLKNFIWAGLGYRSNSNIAAIVGVQINPQFLVSYSYDYGTTKIQKYSQGSHEIALSYLFAYKNQKVITPRYF